MISAARRLPVPLAPAKSALMPIPAAALRREPPVIVDPRSLAHVDDDCRGRICFLKRGQDQVVPGGDVSTLCSRDRRAAKRAWSAATFHSCARTDRARLRRLAHHRAPQSRKGGAQIELG